MIRNAATATSNTLLSRRLNIRVARAIWVMLDNTYADAMLSKRLIVFARLDRSRIKTSPLQVTYSRLRSNSQLSHRGCSSVPFVPRGVLILRTTRVQPSGIRRDAPLLAR